MSLSDAREWLSVLFQIVPFFLTLSGGVATFLVIRSKVNELEPSMKHSQRDIAAIQQVAASQRAELDAHSKRVDELAQLLRDQSALIKEQMLSNQEVAQRLARIEGQLQARLK